MRVEFGKEIFFADVEEVENFGRVKKSMLGDSMRRKLTR